MDNRGIGMVEIILGCIIIMGILIICKPLIG